MQPAQAHFDEAVTPLASSPRVAPIVLVPGIMGSRLKRDGKLVWNPFGPHDTGDLRPAPLSFSANSIRSMEAFLEPVEDDDTALNRSSLLPFSDELLARQIVLRRHVRNAFGVTWPSYGGFLLDVSDPTGDFAAKLKKKGYRAEVSTFPYDWRMSNFDSARMLATHVDKIFNRTGEAVFLVAHSMGGLVSRASISFLDVARVRGLALVGSPTMGSPAAHKYLKQGVHPDEDKIQAILIQLLGMVDRTEARHFFRTMPSIYEILPNFGWRDREWLKFAPLGTGYRARAEGGEAVRDGKWQLSTCFPLYNNNKEARGGLYQDPYTGFTDDPRDRHYANLRLRTRHTFIQATRRANAKVRLFKNTIIVYSNSFNTHRKSWLEDFDSDKHIFVRPSGEVDYGELRPVTFHLPTTGPAALLSKLDRTFLLTPEFEVPKTTAKQVDMEGGDGTVAVHSSLGHPSSYTPKVRFARRVAGEHEGLVSSIGARDKIKQWILDSL